MPFYHRRALARAVAAAAFAATACAAPALAHDRDALLSAPPAHAPAGVCYAHVRKAARYGPPSAPGAHWRLSPPPPGAPGPVWCLVVEPGAPPPLLALAREGWVRVACAAPRKRHATHRHAPRPHAVRVRHVRPAPPPPPIARQTARPCCVAVARPCCIALASAPPPPPPVVILPAPRPYSPPSPAGRWLTWPGKRLY